MAYETNADDEVVVRVGQAFCRVPDCEHGKKPFQKTVGLPEHLKKAYTEDGFAPITLMAGILDKAAKDAAKAPFNGPYSRGASQRPLPPTPHPAPTG
ncbi:hypothetical protein N7535_005240 [Penicillium sp. DV-2018c]|nr:hypothetical protein N7461_008816 [Penicillium sp. DV-2018c]KAJ5542816.1 hypothetical protein N7461_008819 [Penicillium sp. DV-2018c]KAJ5571577.1 hypothetical protein N7535_005237 [Penicillium sp. DV-2018c]KAJ5571580.1 hypothetical protein N7535_005240 [Penicillium sp. DV-2018c]